MIHAGALRRWGLFAPFLIAGMHSAEADKQSVRTLTEAYNTAGQALYREITGSPGNIVFSPYSIGAAMAMARSGARGDTEREMATVLNHLLSRGEIDAANAALFATLASYDRASQPDFCPTGAKWTGKHCEAPPSNDGTALRRCPRMMLLHGDVCVGLPVKSSAKVLTANVLVLPKHAAVISDEYKTTVQDKYAAAIYQGAMFNEVNAWLQQKTEGQIGQILDSLARGPGIALVNAGYLRAAWASPFTETSDGDFMLSPSEKVRLPIMRQQTPFALVERASHRAIRLDYSERSLGMIIVLPNDIDGLDKVTRELDASKLGSLVAELKRGIRRVVALALPRFKAAINTDLLPHYQRAGMTLAFSDGADLSGMSRQAGLKIGAIRHLAAIEVNEHGSGATAVTAPFFLPRMQVSFVVDRPFLFYIVDDASGAILFQGRIVDPRQ